MIYIETSRLILRDWKDSDVKPFQEMNSNLKTMEFFLKTLTADESLDFLKRIKQEFVEKGYGLYAVELKKTGRFLGYTGFHYTDMQTDFAPCVEIGWRYLPEAWEHGYATEAAQACLVYAREKLKLKEIYSFTAMANKRSANVMKKLGMSYQKNFFHPAVPEKHWLREHVLYKINL